MTDRDRIRRHLEAGHTVCVLDWDGSADSTPDGAKPIKRVAARIEELRAEGLRIVNGPKRNRCATYLLKRGRPVGVRIIVGEEAFARLCAAYDQEERQAA